MTKVSLGEVVHAVETDGIYENFSNYRIVAEVLEVRLGDQGVLEIYFG